MSTSAPPVVMRTAECDAEGDVEARDRPPPALAGEGAPSGALTLPRARAAAGASDPGTAAPVGILQGGQ